MTHDLDWLLALEEPEAARFLTGLERFPRIDHLYPVAVDILQQRRLLSLEQFTPMMDRIICATLTDDVRKIAEGILREEYGLHNHRYLFFKELRNLGVAREDIIEAKTTKTTEEVMARVEALVQRIQSTTEIERLVFLRYFAEVMPGHEFSQLSNLLHNSGLLLREDQVFLYPHVEYDVIGKHGASHADQYLPIIAKVFRPGDEGLIRRLIEESTDIRIHFYSQFEA